MPGLNKVIADSVSDFIRRIDQFLSDTEANNIKSKDKLNNAKKLIAETDGMLPDPPKKPPNSK